MATELWISTAAKPSSDNLGAEWKQAGELDDSRETEVGRLLQGVLGVRTPIHKRSVKFFANFDPDSEPYGWLLDQHPGLERGVGLTESPARFWLALQWSGPPLRTFFARHQAQITVIAQRAPEPHPGRLKRLVPVPLELRSTSNGWFDER